MRKTWNICVKVNNDVKAQTEAVLERLDISMPAAISVFLKQVIVHNGLLFDDKVPFNKLISISDLKEDEFNLELKKAENGFKNGRVYSPEEVKKELLKDLD